jgi:glycosyltransferase involved in cell wall biosynthesis
MPGRGVEQLVDAMALVPDAHLVLLGPGPAGDGLRYRATASGIGSRVHALSAVATADVVAVASSASVGVAPIIPDTPNNAASMPNKLFQYLAAGLPVVVSDLPQLRQIVTESDVGVAVDSSRPDILAAAIRDQIANKHSLTERGTRARRAVEQRYNWNISAATLLRVYRRLLPD